MMLDQRREYDRALSMILQLCTRILIFVLRIFRGTFTICSSQIRRVHNLTPTLMPRKTESSSPKKIKQKTLIGFFSSPPTGSLSTAPKPQTPKRVKHKPPKRRRIASPEPDCDIDNRSNDSDVDAVHFEPEVIDLSDEDESPRRPTTKRRAPPVRAESVSQDEKEKSSAKSGRAPGKARRQISKEKEVLEDSDPEEEVQPKKRKFIKGVRPSSPEKDLDNILDEVDEHRKLLIHSILVLLCNHEAQTSSSPV